MNANLKGIFLSLAGFAIYSTHDVFIKFLGGFYSPFQILFFLCFILFSARELLYHWQPMYRKPMASSPFSDDLTRACHFG